MPVRQRSQKRCRRETPPSATLMGASLHGSDIHEVGSSMGSAPSMGSFRSDFSGCDEIPRGQAPPRWAPTDTGTSERRRRSAGKNLAYTASGLTRSHASAGIVSVVPHSKQRQMCSAGFGCNVRFMGPQWQIGHVGTISQGSDGGSEWFNMLARFSW